MNIKSVIWDRLQLIRLQKGCMTKFLITPKQIKGKTKFLNSLARNRKLCSTCLEFLLDDSIFDYSGLCFGPAHSSKQMSSGRQTNLEINPIQADSKSITSRNDQAEKAYRNQITNQKTEIKSPLLKKQKKQQLR